MIHATRRLTAKNRDQLRNPALGNRVRATFDPAEYVVHWTPEAHPSNGISIRSSAFAGFAVETSGRSDRLFGVTAIDAGLTQLQDKAVIDRRLRPRCCQLGGYFTRPEK